MTDNDFLVTCDASGFVCKKSETRKMWNGMIVRKDFWEPRHPQDFIPMIRERPAPLDARMDQVDPPLYDGNMYYDLWLDYDYMTAYEVSATIDANMII